MNLRTSLTTVVAGTMLVVPAAAGAASAPTNFGDNTRSGWYQDQPTLTADTVASPQFGPIFSTKLDQTVMAQPILAKGKLIVTTVANSVYALDPVKGTIRWRRNFGSGFNASLPPVMCGDFKGLTGGLSTPVIDRTGTGTIYTTVKVGPGAKQPYGSVVLHALDVATGAARKGFPVVLGGRADNHPSTTFNSIYQLQRPGLLLQDRSVYIASGGMCDVGEYHGWVFRVTTSGRTTARWVGVPPGTLGAGIWQAGSGIASDGPGTLLLTTGNGVRTGASPGPDPTPGKRPPTGLGQSTVRLDLQPDGKLKATDFFAPADAAFLDEVDGDFASGGPVVLPSSFGTPKVPRILSVIGKAGVLYTLDRDALGGFKMGPEGSNAVVAMGPQRNGVWGKPSVFGGDGGLLYATTFRRMDVYRRSVTASGTPAFALCAATASEPVGLGSSSPVVTSDGSKAGSALVWTVTMPYRDGNGAQLRVYRGNPACGQEVKAFRSWAVGSGARYAPPGVGEGRIYVGTNDARVIGFGRPAPQPVTAEGSDVGFATIGSTASSIVTLTAGAAQRITSVALEGDATFSIGSPSRTLPTELAKGAKLTVPVSFKPTVPGMRAATLRVGTSLGEVRVSINGRGRAIGPYMAVSAPLIAFGSIPSGTFSYEPVTLTNEGSADLVVSGFDITNLVGRRVDWFNGQSITIPPGVSQVIDFRYTAETLGAYTGEVRLTTNGVEPEENRTIGFSAFGARLGQLEISPTGTVDVGSVRIGQSGTKTVKFRNLGQAPLVLNKYKPPATGPFTLSKEFDEGSSLGGGQEVTLTVRFSPKEVGKATGYWYVTATDGVGPRVITVTGTGIR